MTLIRFPGRRRGNHSHAGLRPERSGLDRRHQPVQAVYEFKNGGWGESDTSADVNCRLYPRNVGTLIYSIGGDPGSAHCYDDGTTIELGADKLVRVDG